VAICVKGGKNVLESRKKRGRKAMKKKVLGSASGKGLSLVSNRN